MMADVNSGGTILRQLLVVASAAALLATVAMSGTGFGKGTASGTGSGKGAARSAAAGQMLIERGPVTNINMTAMSFNCRTADGNRLYQVDGTTKFRRGYDLVSFGDLQTGANVQVLYHLEGKTVVADLVLISS
ncbi:MAG: hypothetical protein ABSA49_17740 [Rhizomicrobium sp.]